MKTRKKTQRRKKEKKEILIRFPRFRVTFEFIYSFIDESWSLWTSEVPDDDTIRTMEFLGERNLILPLPVGEDGWSYLLWRRVKSARETLLGEQKNWMKKNFHYCCVSFGCPHEDSLSSQIRYRKFHSPFVIAAAAVSAQFDSANFHHISRQLVGWHVVVRRSSLHVGESATKAQEKKSELQQGITNLCLISIPSLHTSNSWSFQSTEFFISVTDLLNSNRWPPPRPFHLFALPCDLYSTAADLSTEWTSAKRQREGEKSWKFNIWEIIKNKIVWRHSMNGTTLMTFLSMAWLWSAIASLLDMDSLSFSAVYSNLWHFRSTPSSASLPSNFTETITTDGRRIQQ